MEQENEVQKTVKLVFNDYTGECEALSSSVVTGVNLYKKTNVLEIFLKAKELIPIKEIQNFKRYIVKRFNLKDVNFKIENNVDDEKTFEFVQNEWNDAILCMSQKKPLIKAFMKNSKISSDLQNEKNEKNVEDKSTEILSENNIEKNVESNEQAKIISNKNAINKIEVDLPGRGKGLLEKQKINEYISNFLSNIYCSNFKIDFKESEENEAEAELNKENEKIIENYTRDCIKVFMENKSKKKSASEQNGYMDDASLNYYAGMASAEQNGMLMDGTTGEAFSSTDANGKVDISGVYSNSQNVSYAYNRANTQTNRSSFNKNTWKKKADEGVVSDDPSVIYGRNANLGKIERTKIEDIGMDTTDVLIEGEIVNVPDPTELKKSWATYAYSDEPDGCNYSVRWPCKKGDEMGDEIYCNYRPRSCTIFPRCT